MTKIRTTDWFDRSIKPWHTGSYEVEHLDGSVRRAWFRGKTWIDPVTKEEIYSRQLRAWRGQLQQFDPKKLEDQEKHFAATHQVKFVRSLFRHWISMNDPVNACRYYLIGQRLGLKFSRLERKAFAKISLDMKKKV
ncbi:hypothetical protein AAKU58_003936, partial [Oxalobacteraceae bacterium GrIS 1.18]